MVESKQAKHATMSIPINLKQVHIIMKKSLLGLFLCIAGVQLAHAQASLPTSTTTSPTKSEQEILQLSKDKWRWMADKNVDSLGTLFDEKAVFVHMGGSWGKDQEINVIKSGNIWYKKAEVYGASVNRVGNTAILLNDIDLVAVVGGNEPGRQAVVNPFMVTEVYINQNGKWKLGSLTFSRLMRPVKLTIK